MKLFSLQQKFWKYIKIPKFSISVLLAIPVLSPKENLPVWTPTGSALFLSVPLLHPCLICCLACGNFGFFLALAQNSCFLSKSNESRLSEIPFRCDVANGHEIHRNLTMTLQLSTTRKYNFYSKRQYYKQSTRILCQIIIFSKIDNCSSITIQKFKIFNSTWNSAHQMKTCYMLYIITTTLLFLDRLQLEKFSSSLYEKNN